MKSFLDYEGLKSLVGFINKAIPTADNKTIVRNADGTLSAKTHFVPTVDPTTGTLIFEFAPAYVVDATETLVYSSN